MSALRLAVVVAMDRDRGIGRDGDLPWRLPGEMKHFRELTTRAEADKRNAVIMGRRTFESIPERFRPLRNRLNVVLSKRAGFAPEGVMTATSFAGATALIESREDVDTGFVIGGHSVYAAALEDPRCRTLHITRVEASLGCDVFFPDFEARFERVERSPVHTESGLCYRFEVHRRRD